MQVIHLRKSIYKFHELRQFSAGIELYEFYYYKIKLCIINTISFNELLSPVSGMAFR